LLALGLVAGALGCGPLEPAEEEPGPALEFLGQPIVHGLPDTSEAHQAVVGLMMDGAMCSGTLISPRVVLTAAHCVRRMSYVNVRFGSNIYAGPLVEASEFVYHPNYSGRTLVNDIALVRLSSPPPAGVVPIPHLPAARALGQADVGVEVEFVGYGVTETESSGTKLTVRNALDVVCEGPSACSFGPGDMFYGVPQSVCYDMSPGGPCSGDSGGPALLVVEGQEYVVGVTSYGGENCSLYGCSTKVDAFQAFIDDFLGMPDGTPCDGLTVCGSGDCVDGYCCDSPCLGRCVRCDAPGSEGRCTPLADGTACPDGNACNGEETCLEGSCTAGVDLACADTVACTRDLCDPASGCVFQPSGQDCWDGNPCTEDVCDPASGCANPPLPDGTACDLGRACRAAACVSTDPGCASAGRGGPGLAALALLLLARYRRR